ncbi:MAG: hypothetical protein L0Z49_06555 [Actinobacteria bacterium]|nr:hypothetical protein [Actinomycetota bacterium]MCI0544093.1 hypothetical protein [Actinomycetota bacterium]
MAKAMILVTAMVLSAVVVAPLPASAACDQDDLFFATGNVEKNSTTGTASSGPCNDVNNYWHKDGDGCGGETRSHKGWWYSVQLAEWIPGMAGYVSSVECTYAFVVLLTAVGTGVQYYFQSTQNGGKAIGLD